MRIRIVIVIAAMLPLYCCTPEYESQFVDLRANGKLKDSIREMDLFPADTSRKLNYTRALLTSYQLRDNNSFLVTNTACPTCEDQNWRINSMLLQSLALAGDYQSVFRLSPVAGISPTSVSNTKVNVTLHNAREMLAGVFKSNDIVMFSEALDQMQGRTFLLSVLKTLRNAGAEVLALDGYDSNSDPKSIDSRSGYNLSEPLYAQVAREALSLGYEIISYQDSTHDMVRARRNQAEKIASKIRDGKKIRKTVLLGCYSVPCEKSVDTLSTGIGEYFRRITGSDPVTINLYDLSERSRSGHYLARFAIDSLFRRTPGYPCIVDTGSLKAIHKSIEMEFEEYFGFDHYIYFPPTQYVHNRPKWLIYDSEKSFEAYTLPASVNPVLVQAYIESEIRSDADFNTRIPFDQWFEHEDRKVWLCLKKGIKYVVVCRDDDNKILSKEKFGG